MASAALASSSSTAAQAAAVNGSTYHTVYINHPSMATAPITSTFLYHPSSASQLSHPPVLTSALTAGGGNREERVTSTTNWNVTGQCTSSPYAGKCFSVPSIATCKLV